MIKKIVIGICVVFLLCVFVLGWGKTVSYVDGAREQANKELDDNVPMNFESSRIQALINKESERIFKYEDRIAELEGRRDSTAKKIQSANKDLAGHLSTLSKIKALLDQKKTQYTIGNNTYSFAEVNNDALARLRDVQTLKETIAFHESLVTDLDNAIKQGRSNLLECRKKLTELTNSLEQLRARNANADVRMEIAKLANSLAGSPLTADSELEKAFRNYERRVSQKERQAESRLNSGKANYRIDYDAAFITENASEEIGKLLDESVNVNDLAESPSVDKPSVFDSVETLNTE